MYININKFYILNPINVIAFYKNDTPIPYCIPLRSESLS